MRLINPKFHTLCDFIDSLPERFYALPCDEILHTGRNEVRLYTVAGERVVVKSFAKISFVNRLVYGRLRQSKAVRAYSHAMRLLEMGIDTPEPVAALDVYERGVLRHSFFVSIYSNYESLAVLNSYPEQPLEPLLDALTDFIFKIHDCGVIHDDLNASNILYYPMGDDNYLFQLIDINRMSFRKSVSRRLRLANLRRLNCKPMVYFYILGRYADRLNERSDKFQLQGMSLRLVEDMKHSFKANIKQKIRY